MKLNSRILALVIVSLFVVGCGSASAVDTGTAAKEIALKTSDGKAFSLSSLKGKSGAVVVFFATWCPACVGEVPHLIEFQKKHGKSVPVYAINIKQSARVVDRFVKRKGINYPVLLDADGKVSSDYNVRGIPLVLGIDKQGVVRYKAHSLPEDKKAFVALLSK